MSEWEGMPPAKYRIGKELTKYTTAWKACNDCGDLLCFSFERELREGEKLTLIQHYWICPSGNAIEDPNACSVAKWIGGKCYNPVGRLRAIELKKRVAKGELKPANYIPFVTRAEGHRADQLRFQANLWKTSQARAEAVEAERELMALIDARDGKKKATKKKAPGGGGMLPPPPLPGPPPPGGASKAGLPPKPGPPPPLVGGSARKKATPKGLPPALPPPPGGASKKVPGLKYKMYDSAKGPVAMPLPPPPFGGGGTSSKPKAKAKAASARPPPPKPKPRGPPAPPPLPPTRWKEVSDGAGSYYYWHQDTNAVSWEKPAEGFLRAPERAKEEEEDRKPRLSVAIATPVAVATPSAPPAAMVLSDDIDGAMAGKRMLRQVLPVATPVSGGGGGGGGGGSPWIETTDPSSGYPYWYHQDTGETTWSNPHDVKPGAGGTAKFCSRCGHKFATAGRFCSQCGAPRG